MKFSDLSLSTPLLEALERRELVTPTEIQQQAIPILMKEDGDFVGQAQTGTGKTAAFLLPLIEKIDPRKNEIQAVVLAPTRELAGQVHQELKLFSQGMNITSTVIFGGTSYDKQISDLKRGAHIIVGTPGRVIDLLDRKVLNFKKSNYLVLDEADEMLNMGFLEDVQTILGKFSENRRIWMFSATMPKPIMNMVQRDFQNPQVVSVKKQSLSNDDIEQKYYVVDRPKRFEALYRLIKIEKDLYGIVFCRTRVETKDVSDYLIDRGINVESLSGELSQVQREKTMARFKKKKVRILVCTDVAARGIDVNDLTHVFNFGLPQDIDSYVHRIGRTGRAGAKGIAATIASPTEVGFLRKIEAVIKTRMTKSVVPTPLEMKKALIAENMERIESIKLQILEKGSEFRLDETYKYFEEHFKDLSKEELTKTLFTYLFNKDLKRLEEQGEIASKKLAPKKTGASRRVRPRGSERSRERVRNPRASAGGSQRSARNNRKRYAN